MFAKMTQIFLVICFICILICNSKTNSIEDTIYGPKDSTTVEEPTLPEDIYTDLDETALKLNTEIPILTPPTVNSQVNESARIVPKDVFNTRLIVKTSSGFVEGKTLRVLGSPIYTFLGIPYTEPPVGQLRFARPVPIKPWPGIKQTIDFSAMCPQKIIPRSLVPMKYITENITEDCLTINIWSPDITPKTLRTVMVWVHGGAFQYNSANLYDTDGRVLSSYGDVVVVSFNYRNGIFGFLNLQTPSAPGNMGLYDQSLALNWIKENIVQFGGDPNKIVPFGQSAGAMSIGMLMTMNSTKNLFSRAITASGGALLPGILTSKTVKNSRKFAKIIGCNTEYNSNPGKVVQCLQRLPLNQLIEVQAQILNSSQVPFMPNSDGYFKDITFPSDLLEDENIFSNMKEMLTGVVPNEGSYLMHASDPLVYRRHTFPLLRSLDESREQFVSYLKHKFGISRVISNLIAYVMITGSFVDTPQNNIDKVTKAFGDNSITCPTIYMADKFIARNNRSVYAYLYNHRSSVTKFGQWMGVSHYEDVPFFFGYPLRRTKLYNSEEIAFSRRMMKIYSHFAKTGKVLPQLGLNWPKYNLDKSYMVLEISSSSIIKDFHHKNCGIFEAGYKLFA